MWSAKSGDRVTREDRRRQRCIVSDRSPQGSAPERHVDAAVPIRGPATDSVRGGAGHYGSRLADSGGRRARQLRFTAEAGCGSRSHQGQVSEAFGERLLLSGVDTVPRHGGILLTGDWLLRRVATQDGLRVHGVLWVVDELRNACACTADTLVTALERWRDDRAVFLPRRELDTRLRGLRDTNE